jgi:hypothetical protein
MLNKEVESHQSEEMIKTLLKIFNINTLIKIKMNVDKEKLNTLITDFMGMLKKSMTQADYDSLSQIVNSLMSQKTKP